MNQKLNYIMYRYFSARAEREWWGEMGDAMGWEM